MLLYQYHEDDYMYTGTTSGGSKLFCGTGLCDGALDAEEVKAEIRSTDKELAHLAGTILFPASGYRSIWAVRTWCFIYRPFLRLSRKRYCLVVPGSYYDSLMEKTKRI